METPAAGVARRLGMVVEDDPRPSPVPSAAAGARARVGLRGQPIDGFGAAATPAQARVVAVMECAERWAQFGRAPDRVVRDSYSALREAAVCPLDLGLYAPAQYLQAGFDFVPFDEQAPLEWVEVTELGTNRQRLVPVEFVYPRAPLPRPALVAETSSGTAIHTDPAQAVLAAVCEVIERDAALVLWHRRPPSPVAPVATLPDDVSRQLDRASRAGFVVCAARIDHDVVVPTFLAVALRGRSFGYGLGTHPDPAVAVEHAVVELGAGIRGARRVDRYVHLPLGQVRRPDQHRALYDDGPLHGALRAFLDGTLVRDTTGSLCRRPEPADPHKAVLNALGAHQLAAYTCDLTPRELADCGVRVARVLVPGLLPLSFGHNRPRLGCQRLVGTTAPGHLATLLPHFLG